MEEGNQGLTNIVHYVIKCCGVVTILRKMERLLFMLITNESTIIVKVEIVFKLSQERTIIVMIVWYIFGGNSISICQKMVIKVSIQQRLRLRLVRDVVMKFNKEKFFTFLKMSREVLFPPQKVPKTILKQCEASWKDYEDAWLSYIYPLELEKLTEKRKLVDWDEERELELEDRTIGDHGDDPDFFRGCDDHPVDERCNCKPETLVLKQLDDLKEEFWYYVEVEVYLQKTEDFELVIDVGKVLLNVWSTISPLYPLFFKEMNESLMNHLVEREENTIMKKKKAYHWLTYKNGDLLT